MPQGSTQGVKDHSTLKQKLEIRKRMTDDMRGRGIVPVIVEAYGGRGDVFRRAYPLVTHGAVFEREPKKIDTLVWQRPTWAVYQGDTPSLLRAGIGGHLAATVFDLDPYGQPWDAIQGFFESMSEGLRETPDIFYVVANDGARQYLRRKAAAIWSTPWIPEAILDHYGNALELNYLEVARQMLEMQATACGYHVADWFGYYCGHVLQNTHYLARLER